MMKNEREKGYLIQCIIYWGAARQTMEPKQPGYLWPGLERLKRPSPQHASHFMGFPPCSLQEESETIFIHQNSILNRENDVVASSAASTIVAPGDGSTVGSVAGGGGTTRCGSNSWKGFSWLKSESSSIGNLLAQLAGPKPVSSVSQKGLKQRQKNPLHELLPHLVAETTENRYLNQSTELPCHCTVGIL